uniref:Pulmonary surfactant-associated protein B n=1 Tax=Gopherus evgoodei TaxID=1825980 RepID=A0A8C4VFI9_9SAUR
MDGGTDVGSEGCLNRGRDRQRDAEREGWGDGTEGALDKERLPQHCPWCRPGPSCMSLTRPWPLSSLALAGSPLAQQGCAEGPTFWCQSLATAMRCGAVKICAQAGWNQAAKDMCTDCRQIITILTRMAKDSAFKDNIQNYLTHECTLLPLHTLVPQCQKVVDTYFTLFIACLEGQIVSGTRLRLGLEARSPSPVCSTPLDPTPQPRPVLLRCPLPDPPDASPTLWLVAWLCQAGPRLLELTPFSFTKGGHSKDLPFPLPLCWMCRSFISRIESTIPKGAIVKSMSQLCHLLPGIIGGRCQSLMEKYTTTMLDLILNKLGPRLICGMLLMCAMGENCSPGESWPLPRSAAPGLGDWSVYIANSTVADVEVALLRACSGAHLGWQECKSFMERHWPQLPTLLPKVWDPQSMCQVRGAANTPPPARDPGHLPQPGGTMI